jgi:uncharacterized repeat protein (TIGR01451 family)
MIDVGLSPIRIRAGAPVELDISLTNTGNGTCTNVIFTLRLPAGIARLHGRERIEVSRVAPGQSVTSRLHIRAEKPGRYRLTSTNFSYQDHRGLPHRENGFDTAITVDPAPEPLPQPQVMVELQDAELPYDEWTIVRGRITNTGTVGVSDLEITLSGQVITDQRTARSTLEQLPPGRSVDVPFYVLARHTGANVPVHLDLAYHHQSRQQVQQTTQSIRVVRDHTIRAAAASAAGRHLVKVLILGANPPDTESLGIDSEIREIQNVIRLGRDRDNIEVGVRLAVRPDDIIQALLDEEPRLVHFAGHGGGQHQSFAAESEYGLAQIIPVERPSRVVRRLRPQRGMHPHQRVRYRVAGPGAVSGDSLHDRDAAAGARQVRRLVQPWLLPGSGLREIDRRRVPARRDPADDGTQRLRRIGAGPVPARHRTLAVVSALRPPT